MKILTLLLAIVFITPLGAYASILDSGEISKAHYSVSLPFKLVDNMMIVSLPIKGKNYHFMFDTGATNVLSNQAIKELGLKKRSYTIKLHDISGEERESKLYKGPDLHIGDVSFTNFDFAALDTLKDFPMSCFKLDGILGYNLLRHSAVAIDFQKNEITLSNAYQGNPVSEGYNPIGFSFYNDDAPQVAIFHQFGDLLLGIDTGKNNGITFNHPEMLSVLENLGYKPDNRYTIDALGMYGLKEYEVRDYTLSNMNIGRVVLNDTRVTVQAKEGISLAGVGFLSYFKTIIDFPARVLWLKPINKDENGSSLTQYGFNLDLTPDGKLLTSHVAEGMIAHQAGLRNGDQIIAINDSKKSIFSQNDYCSVYFDKSNKLYISRSKRLNLTILRKSKQKDISIYYAK
ncbi:aspartyl protease family protein [Photobacterium sanguinicancri]|uniref:aspartyl protease family protein n=1 Tax=Photobacterium sanguinicancri TaxID=875932 RepID=UPI00248019D0|nr:aspartyl protease family protein [Photobacterium sanguinicancri]